MLSRPAFGWMVALLLVAAEPRVAPAQAGPTFTRQADVIYGRKYGTALTMDVFTPKKDANGAVTAVPSAAVQRASMLSRNVLWPVSSSSTGDQAAVAVLRAGRRAVSPSRGLPRSFRSSDF